jgi:hypothetical protein
MTIPSALDRLNAAADLIYAVMPPTPQNVWPLLAARVGAEVWVKHENQTPAGAFKMRGGIVYMDQLKRHHPEVTGVIAATRGNHGQSVALAAARAGLASTIVVPHGNSVEKNAAMRAWGAELIVRLHQLGQYLRRRGCLPGSGGGGRRAHQPRGGRRHPGLGGRDQGGHARLLHGHPQHRGGRGRGAARGLDEDA